MSDLELELHISPTEMREFFVYIRDKYRLYFFEMVGQKGNPVDISSAKTESGNKETRRIYVFTFNPTEMFMRNPPADRKALPEYFDGKLKFILPRNHEDGFEPCSVSARTGDVEELRVWKNIVKELRKIGTLRNVEIISSKDGNSYPSRKHRVSKEAEKLNANGLKLYALFADSFYVLKVGDPPT